jgi:hypothetical protein
LCEQIVRLPIGIGELLAFHTAVCEKAEMHNLSIEFEHYDFQLDDWLKESNTQLVFDSTTGPIESVIKSSNKSISIIRHFDQSKCIIYFRGKEYRIKPVVKALQELKAKTETISL